MNKKGFFITFEGTEGCGKSTQIKLLKAFLEKDGYEVTLTREPGGCELSEQIRSVLLSAENAVCPLAELLLFEGARAQHVSEVILPALKRGGVVICDRYIHSTLAYQGYARGLDKELINKLNEIAILGCRPDITIFLHMAPELSFERKGGMDVQDRMELEGMEFHRAVYKGFEQMAQLEKDIVMLDVAGSTKEQTAQTVYEIIKNRLNGR